MRVVNNCVNYKYVYFMEENNDRFIQLRILRN